ncbi:MAG: CDP-alcohol phosphatidyltransferase family protein [Thermoanaerobaculaceae bacterium]|nr:CDP-alcohol phosphatidyltransferase family protein [Thermoanaerobaculaceae bacterium]
MRASGEHRLRERTGAVAQRAAQEVRAVVRPFTIPNGITLLRVALTPFFFLAVVSANYRAAFALFLIAGISDAVDGLLARVLSMRSLFGQYLDPIADKVLLVTAYVALTWPSQGGVTIPIWLTVMALSRDLLIVLVALLLYLGAGIRDFRPSLWGKATTFVHIATVALVLLANLVEIRYEILLTLFYGALGLTILSGLDYLRRAAKVMESLHDAERL